MTAFALFSEFSLNCPAPPPEALKTTTPVPDGSRFKCVSVGVFILEVIISFVNVVDPLIFTPPVPASIVTNVDFNSISVVDVFPEPTSILPLELAIVTPEVPLIEVVEDVIVVVSELIVKIPEEFNNIPLPSPDPASNSIANAFISILVEASFPKVIVFAAASTPILIASVPTVSIAKTPPELRVISVVDVIPVVVVEFNEIDPAELRVIPEAPASNSK